MVIVIDKLKI